MLVFMNLGSIYNQKQWKNDLELIKLYGFPLILITIDFCWLIINHVCYFD